MFKKTLLSAAALLAAGTLSASVFAAPVTAEGTGVGKHGDITVAVTFDAGKIQDIKIVKNAENPILAKKVFTDLKDQVVALSSTDVDLVSGATFSAKGFIDAVNDAAKKAGVTLAKADKKALKKAARELPKTSNYDVVVIGAGGAGFSAAITARNAGANVVLLEKMLRAVLGLGHELDGLVRLGVRALRRRPGGPHGAPRDDVRVHPLQHRPHLHELPRRRHGRRHHALLDEHRPAHVQGGPSRLSLIVSGD